MKKVLHYHFGLIILLIFIIMDGTSMAQSVTNRDWAKIDRMVNADLLNEAFEQTDVLLNKAIENHQPKEILTAVMMKSKISEMYQEDYEDSIGVWLKGVKPYMDEVHLAIWHMMMASYYNGYAQYLKPGVSDDPSEAFIMWSRELRRAETIRHIDSALEASALLKGIDSKDYKRLLRYSFYGKMEKLDLAITPTLLDVVLKDAFEISSKFASREDFDEVKDAAKWVSTISEFKQVDENKMVGGLLPMRYMQQWEREHENGLVRMQIELYIKRLNYLKDYAEFKAVVKDSLRAAIDYYLPKKDASITLLYAMLAEVYDEDNDKVAAMEWCKKALEIDTQNVGARKCLRLQSMIEKKSVALKCEREGLPNRAHFVAMRTRNVNKVWFRLYDVSKVSPELREAHTQRGRLVDSWEMDVKDRGDYKEVETAVMVPVKGAGEYSLFVSYANKFGKKYSARVSIVNSQVAIEQYDVISENKSWSGYGGMVRNREDGSAMSGVKLRLVYQDYNDVWKVLDETISKEDGSFEFEKGGGNSWGNFIQIVEDGFVWQMRMESKTHYRNLYRKYELSIFVDKPVYKMGEEVKWALVLNHVDSTKARSIVANKYLTVKLYDVNHDVVDTMKVRTDAYGRASGMFRLQESGLNGNFTIEVQSYDKRIRGSKSITVMAYKQPKFLVSMIEENKVYELDKRVTMEGCATAYNGASMNGSIVKYMVAEGYNKFIDIDLDDDDYDYYDSDEDDEDVICSGQAICDKDGKFEFKFTPFSKRLDGITKGFSISVAVTDLNGETQTINLNITAGFNPRKLEVVVDENQQDWKWLRFSYQNLDRAPLFGDVKVKVEQMKQIDHPKLRLENWNDEMQQSIDSMMFEEHYPQYAYNDNEVDPLNWEVEHLVIDTTIKVKDALSEIELPKMGTGVYRVTLKDEFGTREEKVIRVTNEDSEKCMYEDVVWSDMAKYSYEVGEEAVVRIGSRYEGVKVLYSVMWDGRVVEREMVELNDEIKRFSIPIKKGYEGGIMVIVSSIYQNKECSVSHFVEVPYSEMRNRIELVTFRDKMQPGSKEKWTLKTEKPNSALLLTMYDEALSTYRAMSWNTVLWKQNRAPYKTDFLQENSMSYCEDDLGETLRRVDEYVNKSSYSFSDEFGMLFHGGRVLCYEAMSAAPNMRCLGTDPNGDMLMDEMEVEEKSVEGGDEASNEDVMLRTNLNPSAFFMANLVTDDEGMVNISFDAPDLLTMWTIQGFGWTKDMAVGHMMKQVVTQKDLMVIPNVPRFMRHGDKMSFNSKVTNLSKDDEKVEVEFWLTNADNEKGVVHAKQKIEVKAGESIPVIFDIEIPDNMYVATYKIVAKGRKCSDGEQGQIPVLTNRQMITESMAMYINGNEEKVYDFKHLRENKSNTLKHYGLTLEFTSNPIWYALQALPYMEEHESPSIIYWANMLYVNKLGAYIVNQNPIIQQTFKQWSKEDLKSNLQKNESIKQTVLSETPWVNQAKSEEAQHHMVAQYFDSVSLQKSIAETQGKVEKKQRSDGGWSWIGGDKTSNVFVTEYILRQMGALREMGVNDGLDHDVLMKALQYCDSAEYKFYEGLLEAEYPLRVDNIYYLYMRSYYLDNKIPTEYKKGYDYFYENALNHYKQYKGLYSQAQLALIFHRNGDDKVALKIANGIKGRALYSDEMGMYWRDNVRGYWWYERPIETQALLIQMFDEVLHDMESVGKMQQWLLKQKQTTRWYSDIATANAIEALLCGSGTEQLNTTELVEIKVGGKNVNEKTQAGTGYFTKKWDSSEVNDKKAEVSLKKATEGCAWGAMYWQYFEDLDKVEYSEMGIKMDKRYYRVETDGKVTELSDKMRLKVGDRVRVRILIDCDRNMEYLQLKDQRAATLEPTSSESGWKWNWSDGLSYYIDVQDACVNFYINWLEKGKYILEYDMWVTNSGDFSCGITVMQCMYAPEFRCTTKGLRMIVE